MPRTPVHALRRRCVAGLAAVGLTAAVALAAAPGADASFTVATCQGSSISGSGSTFQSSAQALFGDRFSSQACPSSSATASYGGGGSGQGRRHMGERTKAPNDDNSTGSKSRMYPERFTGSDDPLSATAKAQIEQGTDTVGDEGKIHQIPVAAGAIVALVNFPTDCDVKSLDNASETNPSATDGTDRVRFTQSEFEAAWQGDSSADSWGDIFPEIKAVDTDSTTPGAQNSSNKSDADCVAQPIKRVVRFDESGSTYTLKLALQRYKPSDNWVPGRTTTPNTTNWPNGNTANGLDDGSFCNNGTPDSSKASPVGPNLTNPCTGGGGAEVSKVKSTDGSIGYVDLATAVSGGLQITPTTGTVPDPNPDTYFTQVPNGSLQFTEPTELTTGFKTNANGTPGITGGAACGSAVFRNTPTSTLGDWSNTDGTNAAQGYGICTLTWDLAFDDDATAYSAAVDQAGEQAKARTVKDYLTSALSDDTQNLLLAQDYTKLNPSLLAIARTGVNQIDWNKAGNSGGGNSGGGTVVTPPSTPTSPTAPAAGAPPVATPSNRFSVPRVALSSKDGSATFSVLVPAAGTLKVESTATTVVSASASAKKKTKTKKIKLGTITRTVSKGGTVKITLKPTGSALKALKKAKSLKVSVKVTFTPKGGVARSSTKTITLKYKAPAKKKKSKK